MSKMVEESVDMRRKIGARIRHIRRTHTTYSQEAVANIMVEHGFPWYQQTMNYIETGVRHLRAEELILLRQIFSCTYADILGDDFGDE